ncbi:MAG: histidine--tRNA ligase [Candidatus Liptonbacteria bacterium]|nr:histidine--tRNA ligase [Candidatus Liptonbacteria bacterium]
MPKLIKSKEPQTAKKQKKFQFQSPKGMHDILPADQPWWDKIRKVSRDTAEFYNFLRIDTPMMEDQDLFTIAVGTDTDIIEKEMFYVKSRGKDRYALRPECTAAIARSYIQHGLSHLSQPVKLYYFGPMFRHEQPQAGRFRQFYQAGFEILGGGLDAIYDAQAILASYRMLEGLKIKGLLMQVNSIGCRICRPHYKKKLSDYYKKHEKDVCADCKRRLKTNPLRMLDCKNTACLPFKEKSPSLLDSICVGCSAHLKLVLEYLDELALPYVLNPHLVRGLDYYSKTVFEIFADGNNQALASGGRYDYLIEMLGGRPTSGVGSAIGIERVVEAMKARGIAAPKTGKASVFLVYIGDLAKKKTLALIEDFRKAGIDVQESFGKDLIKRQMQLADKAEANLALILGQKEVYEESAIIRDLKSGAQETVPLKRVIEEVKKRLK